MDDRLAKQLFEDNFLNRLQKAQDDIALLQKLYAATEVAQQAFPIGSIFISVVSTNPNTLLGYGTWTAFGSGKTLVGLDAGQTEFDTVEETGGAKTHTLTASEMPTHKHSQTYTNIYYQVGGTNIGVDHYLGAAAGGSDAQMANTGGGGAHNNLQPYIVVYMWKRTG